MFVYPLLKKSEEEHLSVSCGISTWIILLKQTIKTSGIIESPEKQNQSFHTLVGFHRICGGMEPKTC